MDEIGTKVTIDISEPWPIYKLITGIVIRNLNSGEYWVIKENNENQLYLISCRYQGQKLKDIFSKGTVIIAIDIPLQGTDLLTIPEIPPDYYEKGFDYGYIGKMELILGIKLFQKSRHLSDIHFYLWKISFTIKKWLLKFWKNSD
jgi:hypothetical protein